MDGFAWWTQPAPKPKRRTVIVGRRKNDPVKPVEADLAKLKFVRTRVEWSEVEQPPAKGLWADEGADGGL